MARYSIERRGKEIVPVLVEKIITTSCLAPEEMYPKSAEIDKFTQLLRRVEVIRLEREERGDIPKRKREKSRSQRNKRY